MTTPILETNYWVGYYRDTRDPTSTESDPPVYTGYPNFLVFWWNQATGEYFYCPDNTLNAMVWRKFVDSSNFDTFLPPVLQNIELNTPRSYSTVSSPAFNTLYSPSATNDTHVTAIVQLTSTLLGNASIQAQIDSGSGYVMRAEAGVSGVAATNIQTLSFICPANSSYKLIASGGTTSIVSINELTL